MDFPKKFEVTPLSFEKEFRIHSIHQRLHELSREELEAFLTEALLTMTKLANQLTQLRDYVQELEGKK
jgi:hypothetical protein